MLGSVPEARPRAHAVQAAGGVPGERAQADDHAPAGAARAPRPRRAGSCRARLGQRLVGGRRAAHRGGDEGAVEAQAVVGVDRGRLVREAGAVQRGEQPVARAVAREHAPGAVAAVRRRREPEHVHARVAGRRSRAPDGPSTPRPETPLASRAPPARATRRGAGSVRQPTTTRRSSPSSACRC